MLMEIDKIIISYLEESIGAVKDILRVQIAVLKIPVMRLFQADAHHGKVV
jgi:hypothetical protein